MTTPQTAQDTAGPVSPPPVDPGNALLAETPAQLSCALLQTPGGQRLALTIRTTSATVTVLLEKQDAQQWTQAIKAASDGMSGLILAGNPLAGGG